MCIEIIKIATPYILALIVYLVWHFQKSNEVLADEAKNIIVQANEIIRINSELTNLFRSSYSLRVDKENFNKIHEKLGELKIKISVILGTLDFLADAVDQKELTNLSLDLFSILNKSLFEYEQVIWYLEKTAIINENIDVEILTIHNNVVDVCNQIKKEFLDYAMYRNSWFFKKLKRIKKNENLN